MEESLRQTCVDFLTYRDICRKSFLWTGYRQVFPVCAYIYLNHHIEPDLEQTKYCKEILRENSGFFSSFRGSGEPIFVAMLATEKDPGLKMRAASQAYSALRQFFGPSAYLPFLAMIMPDMMPNGMFKQFAQDARKLFDDINRNHRVLTGQEDVIFAGLLCLKTEREVPDLLDEIEYLYEHLSKTSIFNLNAMQSLSHALTLCQGTARVKYRNLEDLCKFLKYAEINYGKSYEMIPLGILANLGIDTQNLCCDLMEVYEFLGKDDGYGFFGFNNRTRLVHACLILCAYYMAGTVELASAVIVSVLLEIQQQQAAAAAAAA